MARMTETEKRHRRHARRAAKETAKERTEAGIFAPLVRETTPADEWRRWRRNVAEAAERIDYICGPARTALDWLTINHRRRSALAVLDAATTAEALRREAQLIGRHAGGEYYASLWGEYLRAAGIEPGDWCTPTEPEPEPHDDGGLAELLREVFP